MKKIFVFVYSVLLFHSANGQDETAIVQSPDTLMPIAVLTMEAKGITQQESEILSERLRSALVQDGRYQVVERSQMETILEEQGFQQSGCTSNECLIEAGLILGVELMVGGSVGKIGDSYAVDIRLFDVTTAEISRAVTRDYRGAIDGLLAIMPAIANELSSDEPTVSNSSPERTTSSTVIEQGIDDIQKSVSGGSTQYDSHPWTPIQFALAYPQQIIPANFKIYGIRLNIVHGVNHSVYGVDIGLLNDIADDLMGLQGGIKNSAGAVYGLQYGVLNNCHNLTGAQIGLLNKSKKTVGCQIGLINDTVYLTGVQIGLINNNPHGGGLQKMPIINIGF